MSRPDVRQPAELGQVAPALQHDVGADLLIHQQIGGSVLPQHIGVLGQSGGLLRVCPTCAVKCHLLGGIACDQTCLLAVGQHIGQVHLIVGPIGLGLKVDPECCRCHHGFLCIEWMGVEQHIG